MTRWNLGWLIGIPILFIFAFSLMSSVPKVAQDKDYQLMRTFVDVLAEVDSHYVKKLDDEGKTKLIENMINGGLEKLDPYSVYMNADEYRHFENQNEGNFGGVGIQLGLDAKTGILRVNSPMFGTPAYEAGILAGDLILKIDDRSTEQFRVNDAIKYIQGEPGTPISMTVLHEGETKPVTISMKRARIEVPSVLGYKRNKENLKEWFFMIDETNKIGYIRIVQFGEKTTSDVRRVLESLQSEGVKGLILDLRDNPGGLLTAAVDISNMFLNSGTIVSTKDRNNQGRVFEAKSGKALLEPANDHPLVILINKNSASASEIVAAALQDNQRAIIVGERSFGKGSVQKVIKMSTNPPTALKLTTDSYWRPSGANIHRHQDSKDSDEWGVKPNNGFEIPMTDEERLQYLKYRRDLDVIRMKPAPDENKIEGKEAKKPNKPFVDRALEKGLDYLRKKITKTGALPLEGSSLSIPT